MKQSPETRALQHLLLQGFMLYSLPAAVCTRLHARHLLDDPGHAWAVVCGDNGLGWTSQLASDDPLLGDLVDAAMRSADPKTPHVLCHTAGSRLIVPLATTDVRDARLRIEAAVALGKQPAPERLEAFPDALIEREARRRAKARGPLD